MAQYAYYGCSNVEDICHAWNEFGHAIGMADELSFVSMDLFCRLGAFQDIKCQPFHAIVLALEGQKTYSCESAKNAVGASVVTIPNTATDMPDVVSFLHAVANTVRGKASKNNSVLFDLLRDCRTVPKDELMDHVRKSPGLWDAYHQATNTSVWIYPHGFKNMTRKRPLLSPHKDPVGAAQTPKFFVYIKPDGCDITVIADSGAAYTIPHSRKNCTSSDIFCRAVLDDMKCIRDEAGDVKTSVFGLAWTPCGGAPDDPEDAAMSAVQPVERCEGIADFDDYYTSLRGRGKDSERYDDADSVADSLFSEGAFKQFMKDEYPEIGYRDGDYQVYVDDERARRERKAHRKRLGIEDHSSDDGLYDTDAFESDAFGSDVYDSKASDSEPYEPYEGGLSESGTSDNESAVEDLDVVLTDKDIAAIEREIEHLSVDDLHGGVLENNDSDGENGADSESEGHEAYSVTEEEIRNFLKDQGEDLDEEDIQEFLDQLCHSGRSDDEADGQSDAQSDKPSEGPDDHYEPDDHASHHEDPELDKSGFYLDIDGNFDQGLGDGAFNAQTGELVFQHENQPGYQAIRHFDALGQPNLQSNHQFNHQVAHTNHQLDPVLDTRFDSDFDPRIDSQLDPGFGPRPSPRLVDQYLHADCARTGYALDNPPYEVYDGQYQNGPTWDDASGEDPGDLEFLYDFQQNPRFEAMRESLRVCGFIVDPKTGKYHKPMPRDEAEGQHQTGVFQGGCYSGQNFQLRAHQSDGHPGQCQTAQYDAEWHQAGLYEADIYGTEDHGELVEGEAIYESYRNSTFQPQACHHGECRPGLRRFKVPAKYAAEPYKTHFGPDEFQPEDRAGQYEAGPYITEAYTGVTEGKACGGGTAYGKVFQGETSAEQCIHPDKYQGEEVQGEEYPIEQCQDEQYSAEQTQGRPFQNNVYPTQPCQHERYPTLHFQDGQYETEPSQGDFPLPDISGLGFQGYDYDPSFPGEEYPEGLYGGNVYREAYPSGLENPEYRQDHGWPNGSSTETGDAVGNLNLGSLSLQEQDAVLEGQDIGGPACDNPHVVDERVDERFQPYQDGYYAQRKSAGYYPEEDTELYEDPSAQYEDGVYEADDEGAALYPDENTRYQDQSAQQEATWYFPAQAPRQ